jgi:hypothetical protein
MAGYIHIEADRLLRDIEILKRAVARPPGLQQIAERVMAKVERRAVNRAPKREGTLRQSAVQSVNVEAATIVGSMIFGGLAEAYAQYQHEHDELRHGPEVHPLSDAAGQAHYLFGDETSAWNAEIERWAERLTGDSVATSIERSL